ncbi:DMT family transporter [Psychromonas sp. PT13]|uniref:DMT family transporter n=1 Tax=Psychromonas sp. PT13 TaxID=3439547 RepID=UPI003EB9F05D
MVDNTKGSLFMVIAMAAFAIEDMFVKAAATSVPIGLILVLFGCGGTAIFVLLARQRGEQVFHPAILCRAIFLRVLCEITGRLTYALAITLTALSSASAILQATPLMAMIGAGLFFGEKINLRRWVAVFAGFIGVLMIIRPGLDGFEVASLFAVVATIGFAGRDLATRAAPSVLSNMQLGIYGFFILIPTGLGMLIYNEQTLALNTIASLQIVGATVFGVGAYNALTIAMRTGDVSVVSPFRYTRLLFALIIGVFVFSEQLDIMTILGSLLIVSSGVYTLMHSRKQKKAVPKGKLRRLV